MKVKKFFFFPALLFCLAFLFSSVPSVSAESPGKAQYVIKWGTLAPQNTIWGETSMKASKEMEEKSGGRLKNIWYFGGSMGDEPDMIRKSRMNQLQGLTLLTVGLSTLMPELTAFSLPFLFNNYDEVDCVFKQVWPSVEEIANQKGYVALGRADVGFSVFFSTLNLADSKELMKAKVWKWAGLDLPLEQLSGWMFGMNNFVTLTLPDVLMALQTGMVDTVYGTYYTAVGLQWQTQFKYMTDVNVSGGAYAPSLLLLRKDVFDSLPPDLQKIVREVCARHFSGLREDLRKDEEQAKEALLKHGIKFMEIDPVLYKLAKKCMNSSIFDYYRQPQANLDFLRKNVSQCLTDIYEAKGKEINLRPPSPEGTEKLVKVFTDLEGKFFTRKFVYQILQARDQCVMKKEASPNSK